ncbi:hypothetical protein [Streptomyces sp. NPDC005930]
MAVLVAESLLEQSWLDLPDIFARFAEPRRRKGGAWVIGGRTT